MADANRVVEDAEALLRRVSPEGRQRLTRRRARRRQKLIGTSKRLALVTVAALLAMIAIGWFHPLGIGGIMLFGIAMMIAWGIILLTSAEPDARTEELASVDLTRLPHRTESWLEQQRPALPAPAMRLVDDIGLKLDALGPQLAALDPREPAAVEIRKLIAEELPELITGYRRVPPGLRGGAARSGLNPDRQLLDGLTVVDDELARMAEQLASGDLHKLATQGRYLELKYRGDESV
ncbi:MAG TPA: hypothetical protein VF649_12730 [Sphingomonas sp.]|jgi:hypothetical protein|uniref:hypothetical protein n=1 Tax=Sphingomonas sp. TaxID=28214 RepID=UPI002EDB23E1